MIKYKASFYLQLLQQNYCKNIKILKKAPSYLLNYDFLNKILHNPVFLNAKKRDQFLKY